MRNIAINSYNSGFSDLMSCDDFRSDIQKITAEYSDKLYACVKKYAANDSSINNAKLTTYVLFQKDGGHAEQD